jgi:hypothetical protein
MFSHALAPLAPWRSNRGRRGTKGWSVTREPTREVSMMCPPTRRLASLIATAALVAMTSTQALATTYYVARDHPAASDTNAGTSATAPWRTIAKANQTLRTGDTVSIAAGTYLETINPAASGTATARITYKGLAGQTRLTGVAQCVTLNNRSYITIDGIVCDQTSSSYVTLDNSHHVWIANSRFDNCLNQNGWRDGVLIYNNSHHNWIHDNWIGRVGFSGATSSYGGVMRIGNCCYDGDSSHYNLIERNTLAYGGHHVLQIKTSYNVIRNNYFHNEEWMIWPEHTTMAGHRLLIIEGGDGGHPGPTNVQHNIIEGNTFAFSGRPPDAAGSNAVSIRAPNNIVRRNVFFHNDLAGLQLATLSWPSDARFTQIYHNTFFYNGYSVASSYKPYQAGLSLVRFDTSGMAITDVVIKNNVFWQNNWGQAITYESVSSAAQIVSHNWMETGDPRFMNVTATPDPLNPKLLDFRLRNDSPCVDAGGFLTQTTTSGSGTAISVVNHRFFTDGFAIVEGDLIQLQGSTVKLRVLSIDVIGGVLNVDQASNWSAGQGVTLAYSGAAPDLGAHELAAGGPPSAPTDLTVR